MNVTKAGLSATKKRERKAPTPLSASDLPLLCSTEYFGNLVGYGPTYIARLCAEGKIPAAKCGKSWRINPREALRSMGLLHDTDEN